MLKRIRDELFTHMQTLPIAYFDRHSHGELMSLYTNDTDTLRQMISQSIPQVFSAFVTVVTIFIVMLNLSLPLSFLAVVLVGIMIWLTKKIGGKSGAYFAAQQNDLGAVNGYIEEMLSGQKVIKVFCREDEIKQGFGVLNRALCDSATAANQYANIMMPVMGNLGNFHYVLTAIFGGILTLSGARGLTLGAMASFLRFTRSFNQLFSQIAQQANSVVMALAGAERIFRLMDETPEADDGCVTLVNAEADASGAITECPERTGVWA